MQSSDSESDTIEQAPPQRKPIEKRIATPEEKEHALELLKTKPKRTLNLSEDERLRRSEAMKAVRAKRYVYDQVRKEAKQEAKQEIISEPKPKRKVKLAEEEEPVFTLKQIEQIMKVAKPKAAPRGRPFGSNQKQTEKAEPVRAPVEEYYERQQPRAPDRPTINGRPIRFF